MRSSKIHIHKITGRRQFRTLALDCATHLSRILMNFATNASKWKMYFCNKSAHVTLVQSVPLTLPSRIRCSKKADHLITSALRASSIFGISLNVKVFFNLADRPYIKEHTNPYLQDRRRGDAVAEKIVQLCADLQYSCRGVFRHNIICNLSDKSLPVRRWYRCLLSDLLTVMNISVTL